LERFLSGNRGNGVRQVWRYGPATVAILTGKWGRRPSCAAGRYPQAPSSVSKDGCPASVAWAVLQRRRLPTLPRGTYASTSTVAVSMNVRGPWT